MADLRALIEALAEHRVRYVVIGGVALVLQGSGRSTQDLDICYARDRTNLESLAQALESFHPTLRDVPPGLPFRLDAGTLRAGLNFTLSSDAGDLDLFGEVPGIGTYEAAIADADTVEVYGYEIRLLSLNALERAKRAAGRRRDLLDLAEIAEIRKRRDG